MPAYHIPAYNRFVRRSLVRSSFVVWALPIALAIGGCDMSVGHLAGRATDEWTHTYQLAPGGEIRIGNTNGLIEVEGVDGRTVEVRAERIARAATDAGARELLPRIVIKEDATPDRVDIETQRMGGIMIGANFEVRYHVRAPKNAAIDVSNTNGAVSLTHLSGKVIAHTTNGRVSAKELTGGVEARTTNGTVNVDMASVGSERIALRTTNGGVTLALPENAKADISATWTNGGIDLSNVKVDVSERGKRRLEARMNGGGAPIELHTTNGGIRVRNRGGQSDEDSERSDDEHTKLKRAPAVVR
jgi:Putative adhesin